MMEAEAIGSASMGDSNEKPAGFAGEHRLSRLLPGGRARAFDPRHRLRQEGKRHGTRQL